MDEKLAVKFCGLDFRNPFTVAASPPSNSREKVERAFQAGWAAAVLKTTSVETEPVSLVYPMMGGISYKGKRHAGFFNIDLISERHIGEVEQDIRYLKNKYPDRIIIGSIMASSRKDWEKLVARMEAAGADLIECSMSCPQGEGDGKIPAADPELTKKVTEWIKEATKKNTPIIVKLTPNVTDMLAIAEAAQEGGADALCAIDTVRGIAGINLETLEPKLAVRGKSSWGGLSGPAIKPIALSFITELAQKVRIPIAGVGGITTWSDAAEFLLLGSSTVQVCTAIMYYGFEMIESLCKGLTDYMNAKGFKSVQDMIGFSLNRFVPHASLDRSYRVICSIDSSLCIKCNSCYKACRDGGFEAITMEKGQVPKLAEEKCRGCGVCLSVCPVDKCMTLKEIV